MVIFSAPVRYVYNIMSFTDHWLGQTEIGHTVLKFSCLLDFTVHIESVFIQLAWYQAWNLTLSLLHVLFPSWPGCGMPHLSYWLPGLARSRPYSPLVRSRFLPWLTGSCISNRFHTHGLLIALMMEAARTSETLVNFYQTTWRYNPEDSHLRTHCRENVKSYLIHFLFRSNGVFCKDAVWTSISKRSMGGCWHCQFSSWIRNCSCPRLLQGGVWDLFLSIKADFNESIWSSIFILKELQLIQYCLLICYQVPLLVQNQIKAVITAWLRENLRINTFEANWHVTVLLFNISVCYFFLIFVLKCNFSGG
jgi:hypothetical protein